MENLQGRTTIKRRKNLQLCKVEDMLYQSLYDLYEKKCKLKNLSDTTIKGYFFANKYFLMLNKYYQYNPVDLVNIVDEFNLLE